jgi:hypothetical protein
MLSLFWHHATYVVLFDVHSSSNPSAISNMVYVSLLYNQHQHMHSKLNTKITIQSFIYLQTISIISLMLLAWSKHM